MVDMQKKLEKDDKLYMFIPDLHSFTTPVDHSMLYQNSLDNVRMFVAAGLDPNDAQTALYRQSQISAHSELTVILLNFAYYGEAARMIEFKDKSEKLGNKAVSVGLMTYPVLMAADILLYDADLIPVGDDQKQHMELTRTLAQRMNSKFGDLFTVPKPWKEQLEFSGRDNSIRIMSLAHPDTKMSKSVDDPRGTISLMDDLDEAKKKVMSAETDSVGKINFDPEKQSGISNLLQILALLTDKSLEDVSKEWGGGENYGNLKTATAEAVVSFLRDFQSRFNDISPKTAESVLERGEDVASKVAEKKLLEVQKAVGLRS